MRLRDPVRRLNVGLLLITFVLSLFAGRLIQLRGMESGTYRKLASGEYRLYSRKKNPSTGRRRNLGTFKTRAAAEKHEREVQYFKRH